MLELLSDDMYEMVISEYGLFDRTMRLNILTDRSFTPFENKINSMKVRYIDTGNSMKVLPNVLNQL